MRSNSPDISIIIPVYNNEEGLDQLLKSIAKQTLQDDTFETIVVDNGSTDRTPEVARNHSVTLVFEREVQSSYAARNRGLEEASGNYIAFIDSDCIPEPDWLQTGVEPLVNEEADLVAGRVEFLPTDPSNRSLAELYDSVSHLRTKQAVASGNAPTANLFCRQEIIESIGPFQTDIISGGDTEWTSAATDAGFRLDYAPEATVYHPAREFRSLLRKNHRIGMGGVQRGRVPSVLGWGRMLFPRGPSEMRARLQSEEIGVTWRRILGLFLVDWAANFARASGVTKQYIYEKLQS
ncbi:glycosyltransferase [Natronorubrum thiooxidans]|uniref:Glycosyl transferase family 2 n=1 Tax=Natronorubrum thiooxidans TaxID=308853 RepID=A0A1N7GCX7_9EURY|nr:glycosyltransferase [Natronorubrum thiooxidans]SIS10429.1 Glycosyl transferase family 2 [Natronorubrum thiooxidans]